MSWHAANDLRDRLVCPSCAYSLRGLPGASVICPECGSAVSIADLMSRQWKRPWWQAPHYNTLCLPLTALFFGVVLTTIAAAFAGMGVRGPTSEVLAGGFALTAMIWLGLAAHAVRRFGSGEAVLLVLLTHIILAMYLGGLGLMTSGAGNLAYSEPAIGFVLLIVGVGVFALARVCERFVAARCIQHWLMSGDAGPDGPNAPVPAERPEDAVDTV